MRKALIYICSLAITLGLAASPAANAAATKPAAAKIKTGKSIKKKPQAAAKHVRKNVAKRAIAGARRDVHLARTSAIPSTLEHPGVQSAGVLVLNQQTGEVIYEKNADNITPIASITKLMTAMVVLDAKLPLNELISISDEDLDTLKGTSSRLAPGTTLTRGEMLLLALMSSENRAASALSRHYPGGRAAFIHAMNVKAISLGMYQSKFFDSTGLNPRNVSSARELAMMVQAARRYPEIREFSTSSEYSLSSNLGKDMTFRNTNPLVRDEHWDISLSKTGFISEAGRCLVMQAKIDGIPVVMVLMDSEGKFTRVGDAQRVRKWMETSPLAKLRAG